MEEKEVKVEEKKVRSTKSKIITILLGICLFCVFVILGYILIVGDRNEEPAPPKKEEQKQEDNKGTINYELKEVDGSNELYVNNKKVDLTNLVTTKERIFNVDNELLIVGDCRSVCDWYFVDKDANILGTLGGVNNSTLTRTRLVVPKFENVEVEKVEGKDIYFYDYGFTYQDGSSLCDINDDEVVYVNEKVTYQGNANFSEKTTVSSKTRAQIMSEDQRFVCE